MVKYKNIRIKKPGGGTRMQRVMVLASGKYKFVKNLTKSRSKSRKAKTTRKTTKRKSNPKRGGNRRMGKNTTAKLFKLVRLGALVAPGATAFMERGLTKGGAELAVSRYTGYDFASHQFRGDLLAQGWLPYLAAVGVTYGIPKLAGLIRKL